MRERLASRLGFILLSAGCAIGLGNVWRFPYVAARSGGGWFVLIYLAFLAAFGVPVLAMEFASGRASRRSIARLHETLTPGRPLWRLHGVVGLLGNVLLMMFYTTVTGWMLIYFVRMAAGAFAGADAAAVEREFGGMLASPGLQLAAMVAVCETGVAVCALGVQRGLERLTKGMMLALLALIVVLAANSALLDGAGRGFRFYLVPDVARMVSVGIPEVISNAMGQAFFTLSLGIGAMSIFGCYVDRRRTLLGEAVNVVALDTLVALLAGMIVIPACFAYGVEPTEGPGLIFIALPRVFANMPGGRFWGACFFVFMSFAALSTVFAVFEAIVACICDYLGCARRKACAIMAVAMPVLSAPCALGFNVWSSFRPLGEGTGILDLEDFVLSDLLLPIGSLGFALYCTRRFGWGWKGFIGEVNAGEGLRFPNGLRLYCGYVVPAIILVIFVTGLVRRFG